jgi:hypothetical protein
VLDHAEETRQKKGKRKMRKPNKQARRTDMTTSTKNDAKSNVNEVVNSMKELIEKKVTVAVMHDYTDTMAMGYVTLHMTVLMDACMDSHENISRNTLTNIVREFVRWVFDQVDDQKVADWLEANLNNTDESKSHDTEGDEDA